MCGPTRVSGRFSTVWDSSGESALERGPPLARYGSHGVSAFRPEVGPEVFCLQASHQLPVPTFPAFEFRSINQSRQSSGFRDISPGINALFSLTA